MESLLRCQERSAWDRPDRRSREYVRHTPFCAILRTIIAPVVFEADATPWVGCARLTLFALRAGERGLQHRVRHALATIGAKVPRTSAGTVPPALGQARHHCPRDGNPPIGQHWTQQSRHCRSPVHLRPDRRVPRQQHAAEGRTEQSRTVAAFERVRYLALPLRDGSDAAETAVPRQILSTNSSYEHPKTCAMRSWCSVVKVSPSSWCYRADAEMKDSREKVAEEDLVGALPSPLCCRPSAYPSRQSRSRSSQCSGRLSMKAWVAPTRALKLLPDRSLAA